MSSISSNDDDGDGGGKVFVLRTIRKVAIGGVRGADDDSCGVARAGVGGRRGFGYS
jgi:hypothetical protein